MALFRRFAITRRSVLPLAMVMSIAFGTLAVAVSTGAAGAATAKTGSHVLHPHNTGDVACAHELLDPSNNVTGGEATWFVVDWLGSTTNPACTLESANCPTFFGDCNAGYWIAGIWCSTLAAKNLASGQGDCDLNDIVVMTDYNSGPNTAPDNHGTSWNQCTTVSTLGSIFGGLPGTLNCLTDGHGIDGWTEGWPLGDAWDTGTPKPAIAPGVHGYIPATGNSAHPFSPATAGVDCPPSAANIAAGAVRGYCAFVVIPIEFDYYCVFDVCAPNIGDSNDGVSEDLAQWTAVPFKYATTTSTTLKK
jgi:hypothetical protein